jgi:chemotaxis protein histidine kinase CheA
MRERVKAVKGTISISSKRMQGTVIDVRIPLETASQSMEQSAWPLQAGLS